MRTWRVGTVSMGASLLILGIILLCSKLLNLNLSQVMVSWWPIILVVLGIEILLYLYLSGKEKPFLKYDLLSIFLVGMIGTVGIGFAILNSIGIVDKVAEVLDRKEQTFELPEYSKLLSENVKRVVVKTENSPLTIEGAAGKEVAMFGTYRAATLGKERLVKNPNDYMSIQEKGDTLYITVKGLPEEIGPFKTTGTISATVVVPLDVKLEIIGNENEITIKPRMLLSDWTLEHVSNVSLYVQEDSDVLVSAVGAQELKGQEDKWKIAEEGKQPGTVSEQLSDESPTKSGTFQVGDGVHQIKVLNPYTVNLNTIK